VITTRCRQLYDFYLHLGKLHTSARSSAFLSTAKTRIMKKFIALACVVVSCSATANGPVPTLEKKLSKMSKAKVNEFYTDIRDNLDASRKKLSVELKACTTDAQKKKVYSDGRALLIKTMSDSMFVCWYGTGWDFNGTSTTPRDGDIACGYFVTTLILHAGFDLQRVKLAQCASSSMINTLSPKGDVKIISNNQVQKVKDHILSKPDGIFILGLDNHTGFVVKKGTSLRFVHSNYTAGVDKVVSEDFDKSSVIQNNGYFVIGNFTGSDSTMEKWINKTPYLLE